jgi:hypothetical protein
MTSDKRTASTLAALAALLWAVPASIGSAQDAMELDLTFKNSLSQAHAPEVGQERRKLQGRRDKARNAQGNAQGLVPEGRHRARR